MRPGLLLAILTACGAEKNNPVIERDPDDFKPGDEACYTTLPEIDIHSEDLPAQVLQFFNCINSQRFFDSFKPTVEYLAESEKIYPMVEALRASKETENFNLDEVMGLTDRLLSDKGSATLIKGLDTFSALYEFRDSRLLRDVITLSTQGAETLLDADQSGEPQYTVFNEVSFFLNDDSFMNDLQTFSCEYQEFAHENISATQKTEQLKTQLQFLYQTSSEATGESHHQLLELIRLVLEPKDGASLFEEMLPTVQYLLAQEYDDGVNEGKHLIPAMVAELALLEREHKIDALPGLIHTFYTTDVDGKPVDINSGTSVIDELMKVQEKYGQDISMLFDPITLPTGEETTMFDISMDLLVDIHENEIDLEEMIEALFRIPEYLSCDDGSSNELCDIINDILPVVETVLSIKVDTPYPEDFRTQVGIIDFLLPVAYPLANHSQRTEITQKLLPLTELALTSGLMDAVTPLSKTSLELGMLEQNIGLFDLFIDAKNGELTSAGDAALHLAKFFVEPDQNGVAPAEVLADEAWQFLSQPSVMDQIDALADDLDDTLLAEDNPLSYDALTALATDMTKLVSGEEESTPPYFDMQQCEDDFATTVSTVTELIDTSALWENGVALAADSNLTNEFKPKADGPTDWFYEQIEAGYAERVLEMGQTTYEFLGDYLTE